MTAQSEFPLHILHVFPSFGIGGVPLRMVRIINHFVSRCRHTIVALDDCVTAAERFSATAEFTLLPGKPKNKWAATNFLGCWSLLRHRKPDLMLTYNWGSIEWAAANRIWPRCRHIHLEAGFGVEEASRQLGRRVIARRWALGSCELVIVPSRTLERIALEVWRLPKSKVCYIANGIDLGRFARDDLPRPPEGNEIVIGTVAPLRPEKNIGRLIDAFAMLDRSRPYRLTIVGDGTQRQYLETKVRQLGLTERVTFAGETAAPESILSTFHIFALSSDTEQMPNSLLEAMAVGLPVVAVDVGDVRAIVAPENCDYIVARDDIEAFGRSMQSLADHSALRNALGAKNRERAVNLFSQEGMCTAYERILLS